MHYYQSIVFGQGSFHLLKFITVNVSFNTTVMAFCSFFIASLMPNSILKQDFKTCYKHLKGNIVNIVSLPNHTSTNLNMPKHSVQRTVHNSMLQ